MSDPIASITGNQTLILLAELGALLHDLGKLSEEFVDQKSIAPTAISARFGHEEILTTRWLTDYPGFVPSAILADLNDLQWRNKLHLSVKGAVQAERLERLITLHHASSQVTLVQTVIACDRADSGVDKAIPQAKQARDQTYIASVFGYEKPGCPINLAALSSVRGAACQQIVKAFQDYRRGQIDVAQLREMALVALLPRDGQGGYYATLGDTRRAANDVTLADHSFSVAAILKSALAETLIRGQLPGQQIHWKLLGVKWDGLGIISKAFRVNDVLGRWEMIRQVKESLRRFMELEFPIGNKVYDDEDGIYFTVPNLEYQSDHVAVADYLRDRIVEIVNRESDGEIVPSLLLLKERTRSLVHLTWLIKGGDGQRIINLLEKRSFAPQWVTNWEPARQAQVDICPVCQVRPKYEGAEICPFCQHWREEGSRRREREGTQWLDLIVDDNNQAALVTGRFWLESWLHGEQTDSLFSRSLADWGQGQYPGLIGRLERALSGTDTCVLDEIGGEAWKNNRYQRRITGDPGEDVKVVDEFYQAVVSERDVRELSKQVQTPQERAPWLAHFLFRKHPSPARLRRIWRTTQSFSERIQRNILQETLEPHFTLRFSLDGEFERGKIYEDVIIGDESVELYFDGRYFQVIEQTKREPGIGAEVRIGGRSYVLAQQPERLDYRPYASILVSPVTFQFLVPADKALDIVGKIRTKYWEEMGKVQNRLPLDLGIVYFKRKTPLYVAVDAARRMLEMRRGSLIAESWTVSEQPQVDTTRRQVHLVLQSRQGQRVEWDISYELGDATKEDTYYPYLIVRHCDTTKPVKQRPSHFFVPALGDLVHVKELQENDQIEIVPSYFDFEFLDSSVRRYDVRYSTSTGKRRHVVAGESGPRPYYLDELETFARLWWMLSGDGDFRLADRNPWRGLTATQIKGLEAVLTERFARWKPQTVTPGFIAAALANTFGSAWARFKDADREVMQQACSSGLLFDVIELYVRLSGKKPVKEEESE